MVKHRRYSDKPKNEIINEEDVKSDTINEEIVSQKPTNKIQSNILAGVKYAYVIAAAALLSGIFTPLTLGVEVEVVIFGMLTIFLGLAGGILIFLGTKNKKFRTLTVCGGLGLIVISLILIHEVAERPLF